MALKVFKRRKETPYQMCQEEEEEESCLIELDLDCHVQERAQFLLGDDSPDGRTYLYGATGEEQQVLTDCFYLGSYDMSGRAIKGRGCIDEPAALIWKQTQQDTGPQGRVMRRKHSLPSLALTDCRPKYIRIVLTSEELKVVDNYSEEVLVSFCYRWISFTGTHPKHTRMFCFIAWEPKRKTPYCHAFKCEDATSAKATALELSNVFKRKCQELLLQPETHTSRPVLRKALSFQH